jgi:maltose alpha-D-glucosyltransferase/alpha-amylase
VLAYVRERGDDVVLCVNNLSRFAQPAELPLQRFEGKVPVELLGRVPFPKIGELAYFVTLGPYDTYWFELDDPS